MKKYIHFLLLIAGLVVMVNTLSYAQSDGAINESNIDQLEVEAIYGIGNIYDAEFHPDDKSIALLAHGNLSIYFLPDGILQARELAGVGVYNEESHLTFVDDSLTVITNQYEFLRNAGTPDQKLYDLPNTLLCVQDDVLIVGVDTTLYGYNYVNGRNLWETTLSIESFRTLNCNDYAYFLTDLDKPQPTVNQLNIADGTITSFDLTTKDIPTYNNFVEMLTSADGKWEVYITDEGLTVIDSVSDEQVLHIQGSRRALSAGESGFLISSPEGVVFWSNGEIIWEQPFGEISGLLQAVGNNYFLTTTTRQAFLYDLITGELIQNLGGLEGEANQVAFSPDNALAYATTNGQIVQLDSNGLPRHVIETDKTWDGLFYVDETLVVYGDGVQFYENGELVYEFTTEYTQYALSDDSIAYIKSSRDPIIVQPLKLNAEPSLVIEHSEPLTALALTDEYIYGAIGGGVLLWDRATGELVKQLEGGGFLSASHLAINDNWLVSILPTGPRIYELATGEVWLEPINWQASPSRPFFYEDMVVWGDKFYDTSSGLLIYALETPASTGLLAISPDGTHLAVAQNSMISVWHIAE